VATSWLMPYDPAGNVTQRSDGIAASGSAIDSHLVNAGSIPASPLVAVGSASTQADRRPCRLRASAAVLRSAATSI
jgi:hypothetical protein